MPSRPEQIVLGREFLHSISGCAAVTLAKAVRSTLQYGRELGREKSVSDKVPYARHVDDQTIRTKDGMLVQVIKVEGFCHDTADQSAIDQKAAIRNIFVRSLGDSRYALYSHIIRRAVEPAPLGTFENPFAKMLDDRYMQGLRNKRLFVNDLYLTLIRKGFAGKIGAADKVMGMFRKSAGVSTDSLQREALLELTQNTANFARDMAAIGARVLTIIKDDHGRTRSEPLEFLAQFLNGGVPQEMLLPRMPLDEYLPTRRISFGKRELELRGPADGQTRFGAMLGIREFTDRTFSGVFDELLKIDGEFIMTQSFALADRAESIQHINLVERQLGTSDERGTELMAQVVQAKDEIVTGRAVNGNYHFTLMGLGNTRRAMEACITDMVKVVQNQGIVTVREDMNMEAAFWSQMPGNFEFIARAPVISSANFTGFASYHNYAVGKRDGNLWGPAISLLMSKSKTPYYFNFHVNQVGNFTVVGPTGSGKTVALSFLMAQAMRVRPAPACAFFDKDRGAEVFVRALGGQYEVLEPGVATGFNPLQVEDTPTDRDFVLQLLRLLLRPRGSAELTVEQEKIIEAAVEQIFLVPKVERRFHEVRQILTGSEKQGHDDLRSRFDIWLNQRGWLFNNEHDHFDASKGIIGFDLTKVLDDDDIRSAALGYIFHRIEGMLDGVRPFMMFIDEGWKILNDERFSWFLNDKLKTIRKLKGLVGFGTQSAADIVRSKMARTIIEQSVTNMFFPNPKADEESYQKEGFALTDAEMEFVRTTPPEMRQFLIRHNNDAVIATLDLSHMPEFVKVLSGTPERVMECAGLRARYGDDPQNWLPYFCGWKKEQA